MFFFLSKILAVFVTPSDLIVLAILGGIVAYCRGRRPLGQRLVLGAGIALLLFGYGPGGAWLARPLEDRFTPPDRLQPPAGIIVLGGAVDPAISLARGQTALNQNGARVTEAVALALRFPHARIVYTGGSGNLLFDRIDEAGAAAGLMERLGVAPGRIVLEHASRNTFENALFTRRLVHPKPGQSWLLVTSALHMPRAMGCFRKAGFRVVAYPAAYQTSGRLRDVIGFANEPATGLVLTDMAAHEWLGLLVYRLTGKTSALFPAPDVH